MPENMHLCRGTLCCYSVQITASSPEMPFPSGVCGALRYWAGLSCIRLRGWCKGWPLIVNDCAERSIKYKEFIKYANDAAVMVGQHHRQLCSFKNLTRTQLNNLDDYFLNIPTNTLLNTHFISYHFSLSCWHLYGYKTTLSNILTVSYQCLMVIFEIKEWNVCDLQLLSVFQHQKYKKQG